MPPRKRKKNQSTPTSPPVPIAVGTVQHNGKTYAPGIEVHGVKGEALDRLIALGAVELRTLADDPGPDPSDADDE